MSEFTVAVVGPCASGKSTIVEGLREGGVDAFSVAQEHSIIGDLWRRREPDLLVYLDVSLETIRARRDNSEWPEWIYHLQLERLEPARSSASLIIDTSVKSPSEILKEIGAVIDRSAKRAGNER